MSLTSIAARRRRTRRPRASTPQTVVPRQTAEVDGLETALELFATVEMTQVVSFADGMGGAILLVTGTTPEGVGLQMEFGGQNDRLTGDQAVEAAKALASAYGLVQEPTVQERVSAFGEPYKVYVLRKAGDSLF